MQMDLKPQLQAGTGQVAQKDENSVDDRVKDGKRSVKYGTRPKFHQATAPPTGNAAAFAMKANITLHPKLRINMLMSDMSAGR